MISLRNRAPSATQAAKPFDLREAQRRRGQSAFKGALLMLGLGFLAVISALLIVVTGWLSLAVVLVLVLCGLLLWDFRIGAVAVPINTFFQASELGWLLRHADIHTLLNQD